MSSGISGSQTPSPSVCGTIRRSIRNRERDSWDAYDSSPTPLTDSRTRAVSVCVWLAQKQSVRVCIISSDNMGLACVCVCVCVSGCCVLSGQPLNKTHNNNVFGHNNISYFGWRPLSVSGRRGPVICVSLSCQLHNNLFFAGELQ